MEKDHPRINDHGSFVNNSNSRDRTGIDGSLLLRGRLDDSRQTTTTSDFVLQWGNRKRLRCMKVQGKGKDVSAAPVHRTTVRVDQRVVRAEKESINNPNHSNGYFNLRQRPISPAPPPPPPPAPPHRILRKSEISTTMRGNGNGLKGIGSLEREKRSTTTTTTTTTNTYHINNNNSKKGGGASSSGSGEASALELWPPKFVIPLTNREKEEDFFAIKGSKLPHRPKKRPKLIQRTINLVCPGTWLCDLTLERYEVREKKTSKKRPRGLKAIVNMESDSE